MNGLRWTTRAAILLVLVLSGASLTMFVGAQGDNVSKCQRFARESSAREAIVTGTGRKVVVIGDSYSAGLGLDDLARSWPRELPGEVHVHGFSGSGFSVAASPCGTVSYADRANRVIRNGADLVVLQGGLNDVRQPESALREGVRRVLARLDEAGLPVLVVGPVPAPARMPGAARVDAVLAQECERAGADYLSLIDLELDYLDGDLHLTQQGHREFGAAVAAGLPG